MSTYLWLICASNVYPNLSNAFIYKHFFWKFTVYYSWNIQSCSCISSYACDLACKDRSNVTLRHLLETANTIQIWRSLALTALLSAKLQNISKVHMSNLNTPQFVPQKKRSLKSWCVDWRMLVNHYQHGSQYTRCASAQSSCPCSLNTHTNALVALLWQWYPVDIHLWRRVFFFVMKLKWWPQILSKDKWHEGPLKVRVASPSPCEGRRQ